jgi:frataxin-like iron-binding protein CyaY
MMLLSRRFFPRIPVLRRNFSSAPSSFPESSADPTEQPAEIDQSKFETEAIQVLERTMALVENSIDEAESSLNEGVLKIDLTEGSFVLNKHSVTRQIWYSSPVIGPAYFEALTNSGKKWYSLKQKKDLLTQLSDDVKKLTGFKIKIDSATSK